MSSDEPGLVPQPQSGLSSQQLLFQGDSSLRFARLGGDPGPKPRELLPPGYIQDRFFAPQGVEFRRGLYSDGPDLREPKWNGGSDTHSGVDATDGNEDDDGDHDEDVRAGPAREVGSKVGNSTRAVDNAKQNSAEIHLPQGRSGNYTNSVTIAEPDGELFYSQYLQGTEASESRQKDVSVENTCSFSGRKDVAFHSESGELRDILSDPVTGALMDDAMILPCGHSFGGDGIQHVIEMKACPTCSQSVSEDSILPNLSLRAAVEAFRREEEMLLNRSSKRRRERVEQDMNSYADSLMDLSKGRGVQFPFAVTDRVLIKGNKRTPQRFVGREAIVTTQCLNGWYVVKTLDNAESVKLQYRSLAKVSSDSSLKPSSSKAAPNWLQS